MLILCAVIGFVASAVIAAIVADYLLLSMANWVHREREREAAELAASEARIAAQSVPDDGDETVDFVSDRTLGV